MRWNRDRAAVINGPLSSVNLEFLAGGQLHIVFNLRLLIFPPASGINGYVPFPQETMDISTSRADFFVLRGGITTGVCNDIEYYGTRRTGRGEPLPVAWGSPPIRRSTSGPSPGPVPAITGTTNPRFGREDS
jgi:hypothetical protein